MKYITFLLLGLVATSAVADDIEALRERLQQLEKRVEQLESYHAPGTLAIRANAAKVTGRAEIQYWLGESSAFIGDGYPALASGEVRLSDTLSFRPQAYGVDASSGVFSDFHDPGRYPVVSLLQEGELLLKRAGQYALRVKPTPPREVGGSGNVELAIRLFIDGRRVWSQDYSSTLAPSEIAIELPEGGVRYRLEAVARSPGFGPSPTQTRLFIGLKEPGSARAEPIGHYLTPLN
ncbi:MAG: hypothetical protein ACQETD_02890 [Pseudomonadota bacterium]